MTVHVRLLAILVISFVARWFERFVSRLHRRASPVVIRAPQSTFGCSGRLGQLIGKPTDLNHHTGNRTVAQGAQIVVTLATLPDDGPSGGFFNNLGSVPW
jgi:hypothetical protein